MSSLPKAVSILNFNEPIAPTFFESRILISCPNTIDELSAEGGFNPCFNESASSTKVSFRLDRTKEKAGKIKPSFSMNSGKIKKLSFPTIKIVFAFRRGKLKFSTADKSN